MAGDKLLIGKRRIQAYEILHKLGQILKNEGVPYILEAGTLLGVIRENRLLPWDNDVDITITSEWASSLLKIRSLLHQQGFRTKMRYYKQDMGTLYKNTPRILKIQTRKCYFFKGESLVDIFIKYKNGDQYFWAVDDKNPVIKQCPDYFYDEQITYTFDGQEFLVPKEFESYLEYHYGKNWRTPIKKWDFRMDDACIKTELKTKNSF